MSNTILALWGGFIIGLLYGAVGHRTGFCITSGLRGVWVGNDGRMLRAFAMAMAVAIVASHALELAGLVDLDQSVYRQSTFSWLLIPAGGLLFGYGMILANGCGSRALVLLGSGNLRSLVVLPCIGIAGHMTLTGVLAPGRLQVAAATSVDIPLASPSLTGLTRAWGFTGHWSAWLPVLMIAAGLVFFCFSHAPFRGSARHQAGGAVVGLLIAAGWYVTGHLGYDDFDPVTVESLTFIAPLGDTIQYLMLSTGISLQFGVTVVTGVLAGALGMSLAGGDFQLQGFATPRRMARYIIGGLLMGVGGALAMGCSIGQGLSGMSTLALPSFLAVTGILLGAWLGLKSALRPSTL